MATIKSLKSCLELTRLACKEARRAGADAVEAAVGQGRSVEAELEDSRLKGTIRHAGQSLSVKAYYRGGRGSFVVHELTVSAVRQAARKAAKLACAATADPDWRRLPAPRKCVEVKGLYDRRLADPSPGMVLGMAEELLDSARREARGCKISGSVSSTSSCAAFSNHRGVERTSRGTSITAGCLAVIRMKGSRAHITISIWADASKTWTSLLSGKVPRQEHCGILAVKP